MTVAGFLEEQIARCRLRGALGTARNYEKTRNSFIAFLGGDGNLPIEAMDVQMMANYQNWLSGRGVLRNSSSFYMRNLRAVYNKAVKRGLVEQSFPFRYVYTGVDRTRKRAVTEQLMIDLQRLELGDSKALELSRDLFVFSFCTRGMAFVDVAFLRKEDVKGGAISYIRRKTGQRMSVGIEPCIARIISAYAESTCDSPYVFPILHTTDQMQAYRQYMVALNYHNRNLKTIGRMIDPDISLSSYTARHTWASAARRQGIPLSVISAGMGHSTERTTQIYLDAIDGGVIDAANRGILKGLF